MSYKLLLLIIFFSGLKHALATPVYLPGYPDRPVIEKFANTPTRDLIILLHAVKTTASFMKTYYPLANYVNKYDFNLVIPSGSKNRKGKRYWSAGEACCDFYQDGADDLKFLNELIAHYKEKLGAQRIFLVGHSNGAFMANHYACYGKENIKGFFSFAGNPSPEFKNCRPFSDLTAIHAHGLKDSYVPYDGGRLKEGGHKSIPVTKFLKAYEQQMGCSELKYAEKKNFTLTYPGKDFEIHNAMACSRENKLVFWKFFGGHVPRFNRQYSKSIIETLLK